MLDGKVPAKPPTTYTEKLKLWQKEQAVAREKLGKDIKEAEAKLKKELEKIAKDLAKFPYDIVIMAVDFLAKQINAINVDNQAKALISLCGIVQGALEMIPKLTKTAITFVAAECSNVDNAVKTKKKIDELNKLIKNKLEEIQPEPPHKR